MTACLVAAISGLGWRLLYHRRRYGSFGIGPSAFDGRRLHHIEMMILASSGLLFGEAATWAIWPERLVVMTLAQPFVGAGSLVIGIGLAIVIRAQLDLGASWRVGIDHTARAGLIVQGLYRLSRNPIFVGLVLTLTGLVLLMPTASSVVLLATTVVLIRRQVIREEEHLIEAYEASYRAYAARVGRFFPHVGRLHRRD